MLHNGGRFNCVKRIKQIQQILSQLSHACAPLADSKNFTSMLRWENSTQQAAIVLSKGSMVHGFLCVSVHI